MSEIAEAWAAEQTLGSLTAMKLLATLAERADERGVCDIAQTELSKIVGVTEKTVRKHLSTLDELSLLRRLERYGFDGKRMNDLIFLDLTTGRPPVDQRYTTGRPPVIPTYIDFNNTHARAREPSLNFPHCVDAARFDLLMDVALERGKLLSHTQKQAVLNKLAVVQQYEDANNVLDLMIQKAWFGVDVNYWKLRKEKSSARRARPRRTEKPAANVTPTADDTPVPGQKPASAVVQAQAAQREEDEAVPVDEAGVQRGLDYLARRAAAERDEAKREHLEAVVRRQRSGDGARASPEPEREAEARTNEARLRLEQQRKLLEKG